MDKKLVFLLIFVLIIVVWCFRKSKPSFSNIKMYFLHLDRNEDRNDNLNILIEKFNIKNRAIVFPGVDGLDMDPSKCRSLMKKKATEWMHCGQIGCALGHINILKHIVQKNGSDSELFLIFEDDVDFEDDIEEKFNNFLSELPDDFEFGQLYHSPSFVKRRNNSKYKIPEKKYVQKGYPQYGFVGYMVSRGGAKKILELLDGKKWWDPIDDMLKKLIRQKKIISYVPIEDLIKHEGILKSDIHYIKSEMS